MRAWVPPHKWEEWLFQRWGTTHYKSSNAAWLGFYVSAELYNDDAGLLARMLAAGFDAFTGVDAVLMTPPAEIELSPTLREQFTEVATDAGLVNVAVGAGSAGTTDGGVDSGVNGGDNGGDTDDGDDPSAAPELIGEGAGPRTLLVCSRELYAPKLFIRGAAVEDNDDLLPIFGRQVFRFGCWVGLGWVGLGWVVGC